MSLADGIAVPSVESGERARLTAALPHVAGTMALLPGLGAGFVSDDYSFLWLVRSTPFMSVVARVGLPAMTSTPP